MMAIDVSDGYYNAFLINGKETSQLAQFKAGDKVRLKVSNAGASTYFWLTYAGGKITVVANDGNDVEPVEVDRLIVAVSETYDRSEEHTSELQSLMRISYAVFCLKKKKNQQTQ